MRGQDKDKPLQEKIFLEKALRKHKARTKAAANGEEEPKVKIGKLTEAISIPPLNIIETVVRVRGITPYIAHRFSEKAKQTLRDIHKKRPKGERPIRNPEEEYELAKYKDGDGDDAIPSLSFKKAIVAAATFVRGVEKTQLRGAIFITDEFVKLHYEKEEMREDVVRLTGKKTDLRYRPIYRGWWADIPLQFDGDVLSPEQVHHMIQRAGFQVGVGEWRPQKDGDYGRFKLDTGEAYATHTRGKSRMRSAAYLAKRPKKPKK